MKTICFLSDFGLADDFVGTCRGVMVGISPSSPIVDLTHDVPGFRIEAGAEILRHATRYMPADAVYLAVVDPGVGTKRRGLALRAGDAYLVGPDNGLLIPAADALGGISGAVALTNADYQIQPVSNTFHGRDIFAPAAAHLATGVALEELGEGLDPENLSTISVPEAGEDDGEGGLLARIIGVDRYGNARLSVMQENAGLDYGQSLKIDAGDGVMSVRYVETFGAAKAGELILVPDSHWRLSLAVNTGNASQALSLGVGARVRLFLAPDDATPDRPLSPEENRRVTRAAVLRPLNLITVAVGAGFFAITQVWWVVPLTLLLYAGLVFLNVRDPIFQSRTLTGRTPPPPLPDSTVSPERRARWLARGETRETVEQALDVAGDVISAIEEADEVTRAVLDDAVPKVEGASERLVTVAENREKALSAIADLRATGQHEDGVEVLEAEVKASDAEISNTLELLLTLRARVIRVSMDSGPEARAAADDLSTSLDNLNLRLEALGETMNPPEDQP